MGCCAVISALPVPWFSEPDDFYYVAILMWLLLFFGGFILPPVTGIMINSVGEYQKSSANSIANLCYNLFGYLPAPTIYGMIAAITKDPTPDGGNKSRWSMGCLLYSTILTISLLIYGINKKIAQDEEMRRNSTIIRYGDEEQEEMVNQRLMENKDKTDYETFGQKKEAIDSNYEDQTTGFDISNNIRSKNAYSDPLSAHLSNE